MNETATFDAIRERLRDRQGPAFWRGLDELAETDEFRAFLDAEFPRQAAPLETGLERRDFLKLLGASMALAGLSACARPPLPHQKIVPYVKQPEAITPGKPLYFATAVTYGGYAEGLLAESHQGRPTKLEGNPDHPASLGATTATTQAQVLGLYDPDRSQLLTRNGQAAGWSTAAREIADAASALPQGKGLAILTETVTSPTMAAQLADVLTTYPQARWFQYDPLHQDHELEGARLAFGQDVRPIYDFGRADVVLSLDADFTQAGPGRLGHARDFADRRRVHRAGDTMNRLYQLETTPTPTGSLADHRVPLAPAEIGIVAAAVANALGVDAPAGTLPAKAGAAFVAELVKDLQAHRGSSLVVAGEAQPPVVHALAHAINDALGNVGSTLRYVASPEARPEVHRESLGALFTAMEVGEVRLLLVLGANPVYSAPADLDIASAIAKVPLSLHLGAYRDETAAVTTWHVPQAHFLETWSDARAFDGTATIQQPLILPFYGGKSEIEVLAALQGQPEANGYDLVRATWQDSVSGSFDDFWRESVYRGVVRDTASAEAAVTLQPFDATVPMAGDLTLHFVLDPSIQDGRFANNGWLQELPKPFSNLSWDNALLVAPSTAEALGVHSHDVVTLEVDRRTLEAPVWVHPGQAPGALTLALGFGRQATGRVGTGVGVDAYTLRTRQGMWTASVKLTPTTQSYHLVTTQLHHNLDGTGEKRHIIRAGTLEEFNANPEHPHFVHPVAHEESDLYADYEYTSYRWGMVIDQSVCLGCNACVVACQSENNVPIVGKAQVAKGREMHWIRVDNYHAGDLDDPQYYHQPMPCQQCEKAPCEPVCPVGATTHDAEGLNVMVYNRCVGTRYCSNNCPYKVRRFNFLQFAELDTTATELSLANNPDVTVRNRGVMEKCTYCQQRIVEARITSLNEDRSIRDGEVVTACQAACPSRAIVFGDLSDPGSEVVKVKGSPLNYRLLEELNTYPRTSYLAKLRNPNPAILRAGAAKEGAI